jgi:hypothetical protein
MATQFGAMVDFRHLLGVFVRDFKISSNQPGGCAAVPVTHGFEFAGGSTRLSGRTPIGARDWRHV